MSDPYRVTRDFERALCEYTGAPYAVCVNSCTAAIQLAAMWWRREADWQPSVYAVPSIIIPARTYCSVPMALKHAGYRVIFDDYEWRGSYQLKPTNIFDCARRFTFGMYAVDTVQCVSFSAAKILGIEQGGAILHSSKAADDWYRRMRFDGRREGVDPKEDDFLCGLHCIMLPSIAAQGLLRLHHLPKHNPDMGIGEYPDLSKCAFA